MSWAADDIPDHTGRVAVVTGANAGIGLEVVRELARKGGGPRDGVPGYGKGGSGSRLRAAGISGASLEVRELDLASLASVRAAAGGILTAHLTIDVLVNNAGVMGIPDPADGRRVRDAARGEPPRPLRAHRAAPPRAARGAGRTRGLGDEQRTHPRPPLDPNNPHLGGRFGPWKAYGQSKLANLYVGLELDRRFRQAGVAARSLVAHPGFAHTDVQARRARETGDLIGHRVRGSCRMSPIRTQTKRTMRATRCVSGRIGDE